MNSSQKQKSLRGQADKIWFEVCMKLNKTGKCLLCEKPAEQIHHYKPKGSYGHLRYETINGIPLCKGCHFKLEHVDKSLQANIAFIKGRAWYNKLETMGKNRPTSFVNMRWYESHIEKLNKKLDKLS